MFQDMLREYLLKTFPDAEPASGNKEVLMRCRFCGDSRDRTHKHLYISLGYNGKPPMYNCFKCGESGLLTSNVLKELGIFDYDLFSQIKEFSDHQSKISGRKIRQNSTAFSIINSFIRNSPISYKKLDYINSRLGTNLSFKDMIENKIVLNLYDLLDSNQHIRFNPSKLSNEIDQHFVGFLSEDNSTLIERNVDSAMDIRYYKYNMIGQVSDRKKYYIIPCQISILDPVPIEVHIAEGTFDILSVKYNVLQNSSRCVFLAVTGKAYLNAIKHLIEDIGFISMNIHIYTDADVSDKEFIPVVRSLEPFNFNIYLHRNGYKGEKDFGVPKNHIIDQVFQIYKRRD